MNKTLAAIDLGSNSFHMIVVQVDAYGQVSVLDRLRESVRLGGVPSRPPRGLCTRPKPALDGVPAAARKSNTGSK